MQQFKIWVIYQTHVRITMFVDLAYQRIYRKSQKQKTKYG